MRCSQSAVEATADYFGTTRAARLWNPKPDEAWRSSFIHSLRKVNDKGNGSLTEGRRHRACMLFWRLQDIWFKEGFHGNIVSCKQGCLDHTSCFKCQLFWSGCVMKRPERGAPPGSSVSRVHDLGSVSLGGENTEFPGGLSAASVSLKVLLVVFLFRLWC